MAKVRKKIRNLEDIKSEMPNRYKLSDIIPLYGFVNVANRVLNRENLRKKMYNYLNKYTFEDRGSVRFNIECEDFKDELYCFGIAGLNSIYGFAVIYILTGGEFLN